VESKDADAKITYELDPKTSVSARIIGLAARDFSINHAEFTGLTPDFQSFSERQRFTTTLKYLISEVTFDHKGSREGETLGGSLQLVSNPQRELNAAEFSDGGALSVGKNKHFLVATGQVDWQHPMGKGQILSVGGTWNRSKVKERYRFKSIGSDGVLGTDAADQFTGIDDNLAGYVTFQQPVGGWTLMPGVRIERDSRRITSRGHPDVSIDRTDLFPTLHIDRPLGKTVNLTLSYSKRIDRPQLNDLRPYAIVQDVLTKKLGNPHLRDQSTGSYEVNLHYHHKKVDAGVILYDRETSRLWSSDYTVVDGVNVLTTINAGRSRDRGAEIDIGTPVFRRVKLNASINLFDQRVPIRLADRTGSDERFRYTTNATLEWDGPDRGKTPGDIAQLQWIFNSPSRQFQLSFPAWHWLTLSFTHSFSGTLSLTGTAEYRTATRHRLIAPLVQEAFVQRSPAEFKLKLLKTFGTR
jgi:outer membrane receptor for ferrienterochelin and colicin